MRYRLRTLLILMAVVPPILAAMWFVPPLFPIVISASTALAGAIVAEPIVEWAKSKRG